MLDTVLTWCVNPFVLGGTCTILSFALLIAHGQQSFQRRNLEKARAEFEQYRLEMQARVRPWCSHALHGTMRQMRGLRGY